MQPFGVVADLAFDGADVDREVQPGLGAGGRDGPADLADLTAGERFAGPGEPATPRPLRRLSPSRPGGRRRPRGPGRPVRRTTAGRASTGVPAGSAGA